MNINFIKWNREQHVHLMTLNIEAEDVNIIVSNRFVECVEGDAVDFHLRAHSLVRA
jgi:hypothetical protein